MAHNKTPLAAARVKIGKLINPRTVLKVNKDNHSSSNSSSKGQHRWHSDKKIRGIRKKRNMKTTITTTKKKVKRMRLATKSSSSRKCKGSS